MTLHEFAHHIQRTMPGLDDLFRNLHKARTAGAPVKPLGGYPGSEGRKDRYIDEYFGREYPDGEAPLEAIAMAYQILFAEVDGATRLHKMLRDDPGMVDLAIAALMRYDP